MITGVIECIRYNVAWQRCEICRHRRKACEARLQARLPYTGTSHTIHDYRRDYRHDACEARGVADRAARVAVPPKTRGAELAGIPLATQSPFSKIKESTLPHPSPRIPPRSDTIPMFRCYSPQYGNLLPPNTQMEDRTQKHTTHAFNTECGGRMGVMWFWHTPRYCFRRRLS